MPGGLTTIETEWLNRPDLNRRRELQALVPELRAMAAPIRVTLRVPGTDPMPKTRISEVRGPMNELSDRARNFRDAGLSS